MPKISESDDDYDGEGHNRQFEESSSESDDLVAPRKAAFQAHMAARSNAPVTPRNAPAPSTQHTGVPPRRILEEDDDFASGVQVVPPPQDKKASTSQQKSKPPTSSRVKTTRGSESDESDFSARDTRSPVAKRRKLVSPKPSASRSSSKVAKNASNRYHSDDDEEDFSDEDALSTSESEGDLDLVDTPKARRSAMDVTEEAEPLKTNKSTDANATPVKRGRGRPKGSKSHAKSDASGTAAAKGDVSGKNSTSRKSVEWDSISLESESEISLSDSEEDEEELDLTKLVSRPTNRQRAMLGEEEQEHLELSGTKNKVGVVKDPRKQVSMAGNSGSSIAKKPRHERINPPSDVIAEVGVVVAQLLHRGGLEVVDNTRNVKDEIMFNPESLKFWSKNEGNFLTFPLAQYPNAFPSEAGWSDKPMRPSETKDIPLIVLERGLAER